MKILFQVVALVAAGFIVGFGILYAVSYECTEVSFDVVVCESQYEFLNEIVRWFEDLF